MHYVGFIVTHSNYSYRVVSSKNIIQQTRYIVELTTLYIDRAPLTKSS